MEKYYIYKVTFITLDNATQKKALDALNKFLPGQIIVNTSSQISKVFADGGFIGNYLEIESTTYFTDEVLHYALVLANASLEIAAIATVVGVGENRIDDDEGVYVDLVDLSF